MGVTARMQRRLAMIGVAAFALVDAVLVGFAVQHAGTGPGGSTVVVTRTVGSAPTTLATSPPSPSAGSSSSGARTDRQQSTTRSDPASRSSSSSVASTPPVGPAWSTANSTLSSPRTTTANAQPAESRMLLDMSSDGSAIRATVGDCTGSKSSTVEVSGDAGASWKPVGGQVRQVLRVTARRGGDIWFVATGSDCEPAMHEAKNFAAAAPTGGNDGTWYLSPGGAGAAGNAVKAPGGPVDTGCAPLNLSPIDAKVAYLLCANGAVRATQDGGAGWQSRSTLIGAVSISFLDADNGVALASQRDCPAGVLATSDRGATWTKRACLPGRAPHAIATVGTRLLALVDGAAQRSDDAGASWHPAG